MDPLLEGTDGYQADSIGASSSSPTEATTSLEELEVVRVMVTLPMSLSSQ